MLLSVCIPTWNRSSFIRLSAKYWLEQMAPLADRVELIIADNASTDDTIEVLESYRDQEPLKLVRRPKNLGFNGSTYDLVTAQAQGEFVWVCGDDDYLNAGALAEVVAAIESNRDQDHFFIATQFVPADHAPNPAREDPRESASLHREGCDSSNGLVARTAEILELDAGDFSGFYSSIWRRSLAVEALSGEFHTRESFTTLEATLPYAVFVARRRLGQPCYRLGRRPMLTVVHTVSWPQYAPLFRLKMLPDLYELYRQQGISRAVLRRHQRELLDHWPRAFVELWRHRQQLLVPFSFGGYILKHSIELKFWSELIRYIWCDLIP